MQVWCLLWLKQISLCWAEFSLTHGIQLHWNTQRNLNDYIWHVPSVSANLTYGRFRKQNCEAFTKQKMNACTEVLILPSKKAVKFVAYFITTNVLFLSLCFSSGGCLLKLSDRKTAHKQHSKFTTFLLAALFIHQ